MFANKTICYVPVSMLHSRSDDRECPAVNYVTASILPSTIPPQCHGDVVVYAYELHANLTTNTGPPCWFYDCIQIHFSIAPS